MTATGTPSHQRADPAWAIEIDDDPSQAPVNAARLALTDGVLGSRAVSESATAREAAQTLRLAGLYGPEPPGTILAGPALTPTGLPGQGLTWTLDLGSGILTHRLAVDGTELESRRWAIAGQPGCQAYRVAIPTGVHLPPAEPRPTVLTGAGGEVAAVVAADRRDGDELLRVTATARADTETDAVAGASMRARALLADADRSQADQARAWRARWSRCGVTIDGDRQDELRTRFALYHLLALGDHGSELALGARGLTGEGYGGHVFWDADVFVLPALAMVAPSAARAMLEYRLRRLPAARGRAARSGADGARFPWESAASGREVTPRWVTTAHGDRVAIRTGDLEVHITADVVWAQDFYRSWTGDDSVLDAGGAGLVVDAARFWASRVEFDRSGVGHLHGVIGPDEYHENVDDNAFTNRMVAWSLAAARRLVAERRADGVTAAELADWASIEERLVDGFDPVAGRHVQFAGYDDLTPLLARTIAEPPYAADVLLRRDALQGSQLIKQADVVMLHHLLPGLVEPSVVAADVAHYLPRTAHGSSLSPAVHAAVLARIGRPDEALHWYRLALGMDLDDLSRTGAGGLHYATIGGVWQALVLGFLGLRPTTAGLLVDPHLPAGWDRVEVTCRYRGTDLRIDAAHDRVEVRTGAPLELSPRRGPAGDPTDRMVLVPVDDGWSRR